MLVSSQPEPSHPPTVELVRIAVILIRSARMDSTLNKVSDHEISLYFNNVLTRPRRGVIFCEYA